MRMKNRASGAQQVKSEMEMKDINNQMEKKDMDKQIENEKVESEQRENKQRENKDGDAIGMDASFHAALVAVGAELAAIPAGELLPVNLEVHAAVVTALGVQAELQTHRESVREWFGDEWVTMIDSLPTYAKAAAQAHGEYLATQNNSTEVNAVSKELVEVREILFTDATSLVNRKRLDPGALSGLRGNVGFRNQVTDVVQLTAVFRRQWESVRGMTPVTMSDIERGESLATKLTQLLGMREQGSLETTGVGETRQRAFTKFVGTYDQLRRAMTFLRWDEGDVDSIIPSLWAGRGGRGKRSDVVVPKDEPKKDEPPMDDLKGLPPPYIEDPTAE